MAFSFKKFVELVDQTEDVTDEQINELFGIGKKEDPAEIARKKGEEFRARREALKKRQAAQQQGAKGEDDEETEKDPRAAKKAQRAQPASAARPAQSATSANRAAIRTANSAARTGQVDWAVEAINEGWMNHKNGEFTADRAELDAHMKDKKADARCPKCRESVKLASFQEHLDNDNDVTHWTLTHKCGAKLKVFND